ncbi:hypothetical protein [Roseimicrobium sp. ORNL1]|uniref:hypothetical protein n=1 Tax=Roseimicrobium sp. ORNL1 TaxID=2711231 RepID=UPI0013E1B39A|nr:hypothetical protein [Roseimicrobium sp. ORNL1]QIF00191.1 hypothetical protein G5S37_01185 [Roseimicrobium sp. ORNL1]
MSFLSELLGLFLGLLPTRGGPEEGSVMGESEMDREARRLKQWLGWGAVVVAVVLVWVL